MAAGPNAQTFWDVTDEFGAGGGTDWDGRYRSPWDVFVFGGRTWPGVVSIDGQKSYRVDQRFVPGLEGAKMTNLGLDASEVTIRLRLWTAAQWSEWEQIAPTLMPPAGKAVGQNKPRPTTCYHPALAPLGITALYPVSIGVPRVQGGLAEIQIKFLQYLPPNLKGFMPDQRPIDVSVPNALAAPAKPSPSKGPTVTKPQ